MPKGVYLHTHHHSEETKRKLSALHRGRTRSEEFRRRARNNFCGGKAGDFFEALLRPLGYIREYHLKRPDYRFQLDFALVENKVNIELDGPGHGLYPAKYSDAERDSILRSLGWKVIRVKHEAIG